LKIAFSFAVLKTLFYDWFAVAGCVPMGACLACFRVCLFDDHDGYRFVDGLWGANGQLGAIRDAGGVVCDLFRRGMGCGAAWWGIFAGVQKANQGGGGKVVGVSAGCLETDGFRQRGWLGDGIYFEAARRLGDWV
jgi:hypothetical protein